MSVSAPSLRFVLASYDINGTWLGLHNWTLQLQACGGSTREASLWTRFATGFHDRVHMGHTWASQA